MPKISTYQTVTPQGDDTIIISQVNGNPSDATKNVTVSSLTNFVQQEAGMLYIDTEVSSNEILDLHNTPVVLIPQSTNGDRWSVNKIIVQYTPGQTPYTSGGSDLISLAVKYFVNGVDVNKDASSSAAFDGSLSSSSGNNSRNCITPQSNNILFCPDELASVNIVPQFNPITGGDGTIKVRTYYSVIPSTF